MIAIQTMSIKTTLCYFIFFILTGVYSHPILAQSKVIDSLEVKLTHTKSDSNKLKIIKELVNKIFHKNPKKASIYIDRGLVLAQTLGNNEDLTFLYVFSAQYIRSTGDLDSAITLIKKAIKYGSSCKELQYRTFPVFEYANLLRTSGNVKEATKQYLRILKIGEEEQATDLIMLAYNGLGNVYSNQKMFDKAIEYARKHESICGKSANPKSCYATVYTSLSLYYAKQKHNIDSALTYGLKSINLKKELNQYTQLMKSYHSVALIYLQKEDSTKALDYFDKAIDISEKINNTGRMVNSILLASRIHVKQKNIQALKKSLNKLDPIIDHIQEVGILSNYHLMKKGYYKLKKDYKNALIHYELSDNLLDSINELKRTEVIASMETKYQTEKHKMEKDLAQKDLVIAEQETAQTKRNFVMIAAFTALITALLFFIYSRLKIISKQKKELGTAYAQLEQSKQNEIVMLNLKALQAQMNPHFIFNALNSIQSLIVYKQTDEAFDYVDKFSMLLRQILNYSDTNFIPLNEEIAMLCNYLDMEKMRFDGQLDIEIVPCEDTNVQIPSMIIQPFVENAIKHGLLHKTEGEKVIKIHFKLLSADTLICEIFDNGIGRKAAQILQSQNKRFGKSFSTNATQKRLELLQKVQFKRLGVEYTDLEDAEGSALGTKVKIIIPIE